MTVRVAHEFDWTGPSDDPNDEQFGDVVEWCGPADLQDYDAVLVGEPFDGAVIGRRGAAEGPAALRAALADVETHHFDAGPVASVGDLGDLGALGNLGDVGDQRDRGDASDQGDPADHCAQSVPEWSVSEVQEAVREATAQIHGRDTLPVFLGGDNSLTVPNAAPLLERGSLGCLNFDAHLDVRAVREDPTSGTAYRQLFEAGLDAYACVGARHFETSTAYHDYADERGATIVTAEEVGEDSVAAVDRALDAMDGAGVDRVYASLDVDVLDAVAAPGASAPTPGGISTRELYRMLRMVAADERVAGFEVVECAPPLDRDDRTARAAARAIAHFLSGVAAGGGT